MINSAEMSGLENLIRWVNSDLYQRRFEEQLRACPVLAIEKDEFGTTLLMVAADAGNISAVRCLCESGAEVNAVSESGEIAIINVVRGLQNERARFDMECEIRIEIINYLVSCGANPNALGYQGCSALHWAIIYGYVDFVKCLLSVGGDPNVRLCDPPSCESGYDLVNSSRFRGTNAQRKYISDLLGGVQSDK